SRRGGPSPPPPTTNSSRRTCTQGEVFAKFSPSLHVRRSLLGNGNLHTMTLNLSVDEVLTTTRSVRKRLDFDKPVSRELLMECLELALQAPTGSNSQGWQWVFVEDAKKKKAIGEIYLGNARGYLSSPSAEYAEGDTRGERMGKVRDSA